MLVSVISVVATLTAIALGAPQNGYLYPPAEVDFALLPEETNLEEQQLLLAGDESIIFPDNDAEESSATTDHQSHAGDHDHDHHHDHHHLGLEWLREAVPGEPGVDYPIYWQAPRTSFNCRLYQEGYYADMETGCQVFHVCNNIGDRTFLCPNGTIFNQEHFTCQWWFNVDCSRAQNFYELNINIGTVALDTSKTPAVKSTGQRKQSRQPVPGVIIENAQEPAQRSEDAPLKSIQEATIPQTEQQNLILPFINNENQPSVYVTEQGPLGGEQETEPVTGTPSEYISGQDRIDQSFPLEETNVATQELEYPSVQIISDLPSEDQIPENQVIQTETNIIPEQEETIIVPAQNEDSLNFPQETIINEQDLDYSTIHDSDVYSIHQQTETPIIQQETINAIIPKEIVTTDFQQEVNIIPTQQDNEVVSVLIQQQNDTIGNEIVTDFALVQQENDFVAVENSQQEGNLVSGEQESGVFLPQSETSSASVQDFATAQQEIALLPTQEGQVLVPVHYENNVVPDQQGADFSPVQQGTESLSIPLDVTNIADERVGDLIPVNQGANFIPNQVEYLDDGKEGYTTVQEEAGFLPTEQPVLIPELSVSYIDQGQEEELFSIVPQEVIPFSEDQETETFPIYHVSEHHEAGSSVTQGESDFISFNQEIDSTSLQDDTTFSVHHEKDFDTTIKPVSEAVPVYQESVFEHQEAGSSVPQGESDIKPFNQEIDSTSLQDDTTFSVHHEKDYDTTVNPVSEAVPVYQESVYEHQEAGSSVPQGESDIKPFNQEIDSTSLQDDTTFSVHHEKDYDTTVNPVSEAVPVYQESVYEHQEAGSSVPQGESDIIPFNQERDSTSLQDDTTFSVHHEKDFDTTIKPVSEAVPVYQESVFEHQEAGSSVPQGESDINPFNQEIDSTSLQDYATFSVHHEKDFDTTFEPVSEAVPVYQESVYEHQEAGSSVTQGESDFIHFNQEIDSTSIQDNTANDFDTTIIPVSESVPIYQENVSENHAVGSSVAQGESDIIPFNQEIDFTSLQDDTTFSVHHENNFDTTFRPASESVPVYQESELNDVHQDTSLFQVQPVTSYSPVPQDSVEFTENEGLLVQQGEISANSFQPETGFAPEEEQVTVLPDQHVFDNVHNQQQGHIFQENDVLPPFQVNSDMSIHESGDHVSPQHDLEIDTVTEGGEYYSSQDITENFVDQHETNFPTVGDSQFNTFQQETSLLNVDPVSSQSHVEQSVNVDISQHDVGYVPEEYEGSNSPVQTEVPVIQSQQEYSSLPGQQEVLYNADQQYPTYTLEQQETDQVSYQQTNEQNPISQDFGSDGTFVQEEIGLDFVPQEQSYGFVQENQDYAPENPENVHEISQFEEGIFPGKHFLTEVPVQDDPAYVDIQEENVIVDSFDMNGGHINEPSGQLPLELNPVAVTPNLPKVVPEVLPEADSTYESPSAIIPEIPVLYGVPLHSSLPDIEDGSAFEILLPSEVREEVTGEDNLIAPGVSQIEQDDKSSQIIGEGITTFPGSFAQEPVHEVMPEQFHHEDHNEALYPVLQEQEYPQSHQLNEQNLDVTELDQVDPVTESLAIPNLFQFPEEVDIRRTVMTEENMKINTHTNEDHLLEHDITTIKPILLEDITEVNFFNVDSAIGINREKPGHFEIREDNLVTAKLHNADNEQEIYDIATEIPSLATFDDGGQFTLEPIETDTSHAEHQKTLHSELTHDSFATELPTSAEADTEKEPEWVLEPYHTTVSSLYESELLLGSGAPKEIKESNNTVNATDVSAQEKDVQSQAIQEKIEYSLESQENSHEEDDSQVPVTVFPAILNEIRTTSHEDPVLSLVYKANATPLSENQEDTTLAPYNQQEDRTVFPKANEEVEEEERANVIPKDDEAFERTVVTTVSPVELDFATLPFAEAEEENKIHSSDEEYEEEKFTSFPQLVDLDKLFGIPPEEKYEARNEVQQFTLFGTDEAPQRPQTLYETPRLPVVHPPSNQYLPPF